MKLPWRKASMPSRLIMQILMNIAKFNLMIKIKKSREYWGEVEGRHLGLPKRKIDLKNFEVFIEKVK